MTDDAIKLPVRWQSAMDAFSRPDHNTMYPPGTVMAWDIGIEPPRITVIKHRCELIPQTINAQYGKYAQRIGRGDRKPEHYTTGWSDDMRLHYRVWQDGHKFVTKLYSDGFLCASYRSKRLKLAIDKGNRWIEP